MVYDLPKSLEIQGREYEIRSDYRAILDICMALSDNELSDNDKAVIALSIFYPSINEMPHESLQEAIEKCFWFINGGEEKREKPGPKVMDWEQDFKLIAAPVNRVLGKEVREIEYLHWWSFLSAYMEIGGDCTFAQVVSIRDKQARGKKLEKHEKEWLKQNRALVEFKRKYTAADEALIDQWI